METVPKQGFMDTEPNRKLRFTVKEFTTIIFSIVVAVFTITLIWTRFLYLEQEIVDLREKGELELKVVEERLEYVNDRIDRKFKQLK